MESFTITEDLSLYGSQQPLDLCNGCCLVILLKGIVLTAAIYGLSRRRPPDSRLRSLSDPIEECNYIFMERRDHSFRVIQLVIFMVSSKHIFAYLENLAKVGLASERGFLNRRL